MLVNRADSHTSGARFVRQPARWPEPLPKKTTPQTWLNFTRNFDFDQNAKEPINQNACWKNELRQSKPKTNQNENFEETDFGRKPTKPTKPRQFYKLNLSKPLQEKDKPILKTYKANREQSRSHETKPIKTTADQNTN